jgi:hypothetical protein
VDIPTLGAATEMALEIHIRVLKLLYYKIMNALVRPWTFVIAAVS